jgi:hypothetical protein
MGHTTDTGAACERHAPRAEDLIGPATLGATCFAALHDLASGLQAISAAVDELDATVGADPRLRALVDAVIEANETATAMFVAMRNTVRDPGRRRQSVEIGHLVRRATQQASGASTIAGAVPVGDVEVAIPVVAQVLATLIDAAGKDAEVTAALGGTATDVAIVIAAAAAAEPPTTIGATLAIAARALEAQGGTVACGDRDGRPVYTVRLPVKPR